MFYTKALLETFHQVDICLQQMEDTASKSIIERAKRVKILGEHTVRTMRFQGATSIVFGLTGATAAFGGAFTNQKSVEKIAEAFKQLSGSGHNVTNSFLEATKTRSQQETSIERDHKLQEATTLQRRIADTHSKIEQQVSKVIDTESSSPAARGR